VTNNEKEDDEVLLFTPHLEVIW